jgi:hypothetical protein
MPRLISSTVLRLCFKCLTLSWQLSKAVLRLYEHKDESDNMPATESQKAKLSRNNAAWTLFPTSDTGQALLPPRLTKVHKDEVES